MGQVVTSVQNVSNNSHSADEFDFVGLVASLVQQKKTIGVSFVFFGLLGVLYACFSPKEYQVGSVLRPVAINQLDALNRSEIYRLKPEDALLKLGAGLDSYSNRRAYFEGNQDLFNGLVESSRTVGQNFDEVNKSFVSVIVPDQKMVGQLSPYIAVEMKYPAGIEGAKILNGFVRFVMDQQRKQITADLNVILENRLAELKAKVDAARSNYDADKASQIAALEESDRLRRARLEDELAALRLQLKTKRKDRITELGEAISIARTLGIKRPSTPSALADDGRGATAGMVRTEVNNQNVPLYFLGTDALEAERSTLQQRHTDDFTDPRVAEIAKELKMLEVNRQVQQLQQRQNEDDFLTGLEPLRAEIVRLRNLNVDLENLQIASIDREAMEPSSPIKPKKAFVISLALLLGLIVGVIIALVRAGLSPRPLLLASTPIVLAPAEGDVDHLQGSNRKLK